MLPYTIVKKFEIGKAFFLFKSASELVLFLDCEPSLRFEVGSLKSKRQTSKATFAANVVFKVAIV